MKQLALGALALVSSAGITIANGADYPQIPELRPSYPEQWEAEADDPLKFQVGVRYWYSIGQQEHSIGADTESMDTKTHSGEAFLRIDDYATQSYLEGYGGYGIAHDGTYSTNGGPATTLPAARLGYAGLDFGWLPLGNEQASVGFIAGYQFSNDSPDTGRANFTTATTAANTTNVGGLWVPTGGDSEINSFDVHALKVGLGGRLDMHGFDITGEAAVTPYAWINGTYGAYSAPGQTAIQQQASAAAINGHGYGASGKLMVGFKPTENLAIRVGGRASYLTGQYDVTWDEVTVNQPVAPATTPSLSRQTYIISNNPFSMLRYGALVEIAGSF